MKTNRSSRPANLPSGEQRRYSLLLQVTALFLIGVITTGVITFLIQHIRTNATVKEQTEKLAAEIAQEVKLSVKEYPAYAWLMHYWYEHADELDIEYDTAFTDDHTQTEEKCRLLTERYPAIQLRYATTEEIRQMSDEDQRLYAEITYAWLITRVNEIKRTYRVDYLFCVVTEEPYLSQVFLFSAADAGAVRGTNYEEVYPLGTTATVSESQQEAMRSATANASYLADAGVYVDYYTYLDRIGEHDVLIGMTYNLSGLRSVINAQTWSSTGFAMLHQVFLSAICMILISLFVLRPLKKVQKNIRMYQQTKDSAIVAQNLRKVRPHNEIGELSADVSDLAQAIDRYLRDIQMMTAENERISTELSLATRIQATMLPHIFPPFPERNEFDLYASMTPAKEVGGDFYDFFMVDDDHLCITIADVSGKGVPAALFMMASKIVLASNAVNGKSPAQILADTNAAICANNTEQMFVTVWLGILEISTGKLTAANAGHEYPMLRLGNGAFELYKDKHGFVIGGMDGVPYKEYEIQLTPGSKLFVYTDGVAEATDADENLFGTERTLAALNSAPDATPQQLLKNVQSAVDAFVKDAEQFDDLTMLCLEYKG